MSIQEHLNKIRNAIYGREVRESIAKGIETAYDDASEKDNANMEVKIARGTHPNLRSRLEEVDNKQQQTTAQFQQTEQNLSSQLAQKVDKGGNEQVTWGMLDQVTKENITGGNTPVVGVNSVNTSNLVNNAATFVKRSRLGDLPQVQLTGNLPNIVNNSIVFDATFRVVIGRTRYEVTDGAVLDYSHLVGSVTQIMIYFNTADLTFSVIPPNNLNVITENHVLFGILGFSTGIGLRDILLPTDYMLNGYNPGRYYEQLLKDDLLRGTTTTITWHTNNTPQSIIYRNNNDEVVRVDEYSTVGNTIIEKRSVPNIVSVTLTHNLVTLQTEVN